MHGWLRFVMPVPIALGGLLVGFNTLQIAHQVCLLTCEAFAYYQSEPQRAALQIHLDRKTEVVDEVMAGRMTVRAAANEFARLHRELPILFRSHGAGGHRPGDFSSTGAGVPECPDARSARSRPRAGQVARYRIRIRESTRVVKANPRPFAFEDGAHDRFPSFASRVHPD
ncbi:MAG: hypothetical protein AB7K24_02825 [Gemmataceae bacterium]